MSPTRRAVLLTLPLALLGLGVSVYLTYEHYSTSATLACPDTGAINCVKVTSSSYSELAGVPVALLGLLYYVGVVALCLPVAWRAASPWVSRLRIAALAGGVGVRRLPGVGGAVPDRRHLPVVHRGPRVHRGCSSRSWCSSRPSHRRPPPLSRRPRLPRVVGRPPPEARRPASRRSPPRRRSTSSAGGAAVPRGPAGEAAGPPRRRPARRRRRRGGRAAVAGRRPPAGSSRRWRSEASTCSSAVVMRSAPGLPIASAAPSARRPTVGAMLLARRVPGGSWSTAVELALAQAVVEPQPGAGHRGTRAVAVGRGHGARAAVGVDHRHVRGARRRRTGVPDTAQQLPGGGSPVVSDVDPLAAHLEHLPLHLHQVRHVVRRPLAARPVAQQGQHRREHRPADGGRRVGPQPPGADVDGQGGPDHRAVRREVLGRDQAAAGGHVVGDDRSEVAGVERVRAVGGQRRQRVGQVGRRPRGRRSRASARPAPPGRPGSAGSQPKSESRTYGR